MTDCIVLFLSRCFDCTDSMFGTVVVKPKNEAISRHFPDVTCRVN